MLLRKSPPLTPARLDANRRNAQKSTGPRTAHGRAYSRMNALKKGWSSRFYRDLLSSLVYAPPGTLEGTIKAILTPQQAAHPLFAEAAEIACEAETQVILEYRHARKFIGEMA